MGYTHHGVYVGGGWVVHFDGGPESKFGSRIRCCTLATFADGGDVEVVRHRRSLPPTEVVARAEGSIGDADYHLFDNNCEHFATWCVTGHARSKQVETVREPWAGALVAATCAAGISLLGAPLGIPVIIVGGLVAWLSEDDK